ncbi:hypothetical protein GP486_001366 [Trichoglossum hirsutum]|uniref:Uncharacterized protein n=1 Tax=Trichoglossum hirsutum TaxID=265104 RepID=A0A9P8LH69_9PEZI|nr:hypothetical protein GP486_001366 [Trichoglossum hirsutum]
MHASGILLAVSLCGFHLTASGLIALRQANPEAAGTYGLTKRVVVPPKVPKPVDPVGAPKVDPATEGCKRSWLGVRGGCPPPTNPNPGEGNGNSPKAPSDGSKSSSHSSRVSEINSNAAVDPSTGMSVVRTPAEYEQSGQQALSANTMAIKNLKDNQAAVAKDPSVKKMTDKEYPPYSERYDKNRANNFKAETDNVENYPGLAPTLQKLSIEKTDEEWSYVELTSKGQMDSFKPTMIAMTNKDSETVVVTNAIKSYDVGLPEHQQLPNFELAYQIWKEEAGPAAGSLRFIGQYPVANKGSLETLRIIHGATGKGPTELATIKPGQPGFDELIGAYWQRINGIDNTKGASWMLADHVVTLGGKKVVAIHESPELPGDSSSGIIFLELGN